MEEGPTALILSPYLEFRVYRGYERMILIYEACSKMQAYPMVLAIDGIKGLKYVLS